MTKIVSEIKAGLFGKKGLVFKYSVFPNKQIKPSTVNWRVSHKISCTLV